MDLKHLEEPHSEAERLAVDAVLGPESLTSSPESFRQTLVMRTWLLPTLISLQSRVGYIGPGGLGYACRRLGVPPAEAWGVATFYALLALDERPREHAHVCDDLACQMKGAEALCAQLEKDLGPSTERAHRADPAGRHEKTEARWSRSPCLGLCEQAPAVMVTVAGDPPLEQAFGGATVQKVRDAMSGKRIAAQLPTLGGVGPRRLLARAGVIDPMSLDEYRSHGGYEALRRAVELGPDAVIREVTEARLVGRGGAAFPTGRKWDAVAKASTRPRYVVCNADESEPGTFKDRVLLEGDPYALVEAMTLAGFATGAEQGYLYLRGEYPLALQRLSHAIAMAKARGLLGADVMGKGFKFELEVRRGAGAYICGEETALFASIEGFRGEPRTKPPFPVQSGLFGKPTAINNVETLAATLDIVRLGAAEYAKAGTAASPGTKLFCVSGAVAKPGVYEVPFGTRLTALLELCGGVPKGHKLKGILMGGAAGTFLGPDALDLELSFEGARAAGTTLGSGVVLVLDESADLPALLRRLAAFFRDESCGQCVPCRVGTVRQEELLARLARGAPLGSQAQEEALLAELGQAMRDASICGLGQTASSAIESALKTFKLFGGRP